MKIMTILGSPRKRGNTNAVLQLFEEYAASEHQVTRLNVVDFNIQGCCGCDACQKVLSEPGCRRKDDFLDVLQQLMAADLVVYAAPVYVWSFPAQMKALIDRHYCTVKWQDDQKAVTLLQGLRAALLVTCGGAAEENADLIRIEFQRQMDYLRGQLTGFYVVDGCTTPKEVLAAGKASFVASQMVSDLLRLSIQA